MKIQIISLFPEMFEGVFEHSMMFKAQDRDLASFEIVNLRDFGLGERKTVDDTPYGGGDGMLLKIEPLAAAIEYCKAKQPEAKVVLLTPRGKTYKQSTAKKLSKEEALILVCGRYEGFDERVTDYVDMEISLGNYVMTGGEIAAMAIADSVVRLIPGVLGGENSAEIESFTDDNRVEFAQYTRPENYKGKSVPEVLLSGNHREIVKWRKQEALNKTQELKKTEE